MSGHPGITQVCSPFASNAESAPSPKTRAKNKMSSHSTKEIEKPRHQNNNARALLRANDVRSVQNEIGDFRAIDVRGGRRKINQKSLRSALSSTITKPIE
jgi:hypothetical protein